MGTLAKEFLGADLQKTLQDGVTIVVTVFNKAYALPHVIEALREEARVLPLELIFVDDGSTDGSAELICRLCAAFDHVLVLCQPNSGPSHALNRGLAAVGTTYTKPLDGDDILLPGALGALLSALRGQRRCRWAYGPGVGVEAFPPTAGGRWQGEAAYSFRTAADQFRRSLRRSCTTPSAWLAETSLLAEVGFCDPRVFVQDYSLELRLALASPALVTATPVFAYERAAGPFAHLSADQRQTLHDLNAAVAGLFADEGARLRAWRRTAARRLAGRAWRWARRHEGKTFASREFRRFLAGYLGLGDPLRSMRESTAAFGAPVRRPPAMMAPARTLLARGRFAAFAPAAAAAAGRGA